MFERCFKEEYVHCSKCFKEVSCCMSIIAATQAEGGIVSFFFIKSHLPLKFIFGAKLYSLHTPMEKFRDSQSGEMIYDGSEGFPRLLILMVISMPY